MDNLTISLVNKQTPHELEVTFQEAGRSKNHIVLSESGVHLIARVSSPLPCCRIGVV